MTLHQMLSVSIWPLMKWISHPSSKSDVEPDDPPAAPLQSKVPSNLTENKSGNLTGQEKRTALTKWTPSPMAVLETTKANPCERKKFELKMLPCPIKQSSVSSELRVVPKQKAENPLPLPLHWPMLIFKLCKQRCGPPLAPYRL